MTATIRNTTAAMHVDTLDIPTRPDGTRYRFELIHGYARTYADTADELLAAVIPGYGDLPDEAARLRARMWHTARLQVNLQAGLVTPVDIANSTPAEQDILLGFVGEPPAVDSWDSPVPLVLIDSDYAPYTDRTRPAGVPDVEHPDNVIWLSPTDPYDLLSSLHRAGTVTLSEDTEQAAR